MDWLLWIKVNGFRWKKPANASPNGLQSLPLPPSLTDLERIVTYVALDDPAAATRLGTQLLDAALSLATFPERGRVVPEFRRPELREIVLRSYRIIHRVNGRDVGLEIVRFWHAARGFPQIPRTQ